MTNASTHVSEEGDAGHHVGGGSRLALGLGALGVVFGDIGTSPLCAFREAFDHQHLTVDTITGPWGRDGDHLYMSTRAAPPACPRA